MEVEKLAVEAVQPEEAIEDASWEVLDNLGGEVRRLTVSVPDKSLEEGVSLEEDW